MRILRPIEALCLVLLFGGCATVHRPGTIPVGEWAGAGEFVQAAWHGPAAQPDARTRPASELPVSPARAFPTVLGVTATRPAPLAALGEPELRYKRYSTWLHIRTVNSDGRIVNEIEICSKSGVIEDNEDIHLRFGLREYRRLSDLTVIYQLAFAQSKGREAEYPAPYAATCTTVGKRTTLLVEYEVGANFFFDVLQFEGDTVQKSGSYAESPTLGSAVKSPASPKIGFIHWTEHLTRQRGSAHAQ